LQTSSTIHRSSLRSIICWIAIKASRSIRPTRVLVHTDLGLHNVAVDPETKEVRGVFDYDGAAWADRHHDFRYLVLSIPHEPVLMQHLRPTSRRSAPDRSAKSLALQRRVCGFFPGVPARRAG
jgi:aminoglycoside phosphotransferase (APT) family kinase protein